LVGRSCVESFLQVARIASPCEARRSCEEFFLQVVLAKLGEERSRSGSCFAAGDRAYIRFRIKIAESSNAISSQNIEYFYRSFKCYKNYKKCR
jgi:hypothetical protein